VTFEELVSKIFEKFLVISGIRELLNFFTPGLLPLSELLLQDGAIKFLLGIEVTEDNCFIHLSVCREIPSRGSAKSVPRKYLDCGLYDVLPFPTFFHK
jgi:hypothetical protein